MDRSNSLRWLDKIGAPSDRRVTYLWSGSPDSNFTTIFLYIFYCLKFKGVRWAAPPLKAVPRAAVARLACQVSQCFVVGHPIWRWFSKAYWIPVLVTHITKIGTRPSDFVRVWCDDDDGRRWLLCQFCVKKIKITKVFLLWQNLGPLIGPLIFVWKN